MNKYVEFNIRVKKPGMAGPTMAELMSTVHFALVNCQCDQLGVSFPNYDTTLGSKLRVHGTEDQVRVFTLNLSSLPAGVSMTTMQEVPEEVTWTHFYRVRPSKQLSKLKAGVKSGHITDPKVYRIKMCEEVLSEPFFITKSSSTKQVYKRFVGKKEASPQASGSFDSFGMSMNAAVPVF